MEFFEWFDKHFLHGIKEDELKTDFTDQEKEILRPIAETLALIDGNAFFTMETVTGKPFYETYLIEANVIYQANGGDNGWSGEASFAKRVLNNE